MRFDRRSKAPRGPIRPPRSRVTSLLVALVMVIMAIQIAADPATWSWLFPNPDGDNPARNEEADVSFDVALDSAPPLRPDEFVSEPEPIRGGAETADSSIPSSHEELIAGIDWNVIEDNTLGLRSAEVRISREILSRLRRTPANQLAEFVQPAPTFGAVMLEPAHYRGDYFEIQGEARRILEMPSRAPAADETAPAPPTTYELWVFTRDSGLNPWRVLTAEIPESLPLGFHEDGIPVRIRGMFFKRQGYETLQHALHVAPVLLAKSVDYRPGQPAKADATPERATTWILGAILIGGVGLAFLAWRLRRSDARFEKHVLHRYQNQREPSDTAEPQVDPSEFLQQLANSPVIPTSDAPIPPAYRRES